MTDTAAGVSIGRVVHFYPAVSDDWAKYHDHSGPMAAIVTEVSEEEEEQGIISLTFFPPGGGAIGRHEVIFYTQQEHEAHRGTERTLPYWIWPPRK